MGCEVKSLRLGHVNLANSFVHIVSGEMWLKNCYIKTYEKTTSFCPDERQKRKLLVSKSDILKIQSKVVEKGLTLVPLKIYFNQRNLVKLEIGIVRGKKLFDKRKALKEKDLKREQARFESQWVHSKKRGRLGFDISNRMRKSESKSHFVKREIKIKRKQRSFCTLWCNGISSLVYA